MNRLDLNKRNSVSNFHSKALSILLLFTSFGLITGCNTQPVKETVDALVAKVAEPFEPAALTQLQKAAENQQWDSAAQFIDKIDTSRLNDEQFYRFSVFSSQTKMQQGDSSSASSIINNQRLATLLPQLEANQQYKVVDLQAQLDSKAKRWINAAKKRIFIAPLLSSPESQINQNAIWTAVNSIPKNELNTLTQIQTLNAANTDASSFELQGWLQLAIINQSSEEDLATQSARLSQWQQTYQNHSAAQNLPQSIALLEELVANTPKHIALVLPLTGRLAPAGQTLLNGFLAAFYQHSNEPGGDYGLPKISVYDSMTVRELPLLYKELKSQQVDFVIGPIQKNLVKKLLEFDDLPIPTLSLNYIYDAGYSPIGLYQFGLSINAEAQQLAHLAHLDSHKRALIIGPKHSWTTRAADNFQKQWERDGGTVTAREFYNNKERETSASETIKKLFEIDFSHARFREIRNATAIKLEFEPRRRQDVDMILMLGKPQQARSTKPLFAFHYGADVPVYSTSQSHDFDATRRQNTDLKGLKFTDIPWLLGEPDEFLTALSERDKSSPYIRLYAMGIDCFNLYPRIKQLAHHKGSLFYGRTGTLSIQDNTTLIRHLALAQYQDNEAKLISTDHGIQGSFSDSFNPSFNGQNKPRSNVIPDGAISTKLPLKAPEPLKGPEAQNQP